MVSFKWSVKCLVQLVQSPHLRVKICQVKNHQQLDHPSWIFHGHDDAMTSFYTTEEVYVVSGKQIKAKYQDLFLNIDPL